MEKNRSLQVPLEEASLLLQTPAKAKETQKSSDREMKQHKNAPMGVRTSYMIFHRMECERLKIIHGKGSPGQIRNMANDAWKRLSEHDRQVYFSFIRSIMKLNHVPVDLLHTYIISGIMKIEISFRPFNN